jgi:hypothetical protein
MSASNAFETQLLQLIFNNTNAANIGDATGLRGSSTAGVFYIGLHTADPGEAGTQSTSETAYTSYARQSVVRSHWLRRRRGYALQHRDGRFRRGKPCHVGSADELVSARTSKRSELRHWGPYGDC